MERVPLQARLRRPGAAAQTALVRTMLPLLGGLIEAGSEVDPVVTREVESLPEGLVFGMSVFGSDLGMRMQKRGSRLVLLDPAKAPRPQLDIVFKHLGLAFLVVSFQESTALAFARGRMVVHGDTALAMRITRCMDRMEAVTLPGLVAERALKSVPLMDPRERLPLAAKYYAAAARGALRRS